MLNAENDNNIIGGTDADQDKEIKFTDVDEEISDAIFENIQENAPPVTEVLKQVSLGKS